jgi:tRNA threonylcarbamoyladenosine biosynthesis protein TsaE
MNARALKYKSGSAAQTKRIARSLAKILEEGDVVTLSGELGAGKTTFAKGLIRALGAVRTEDAVSSPTFVIIHQYEVPIGVTAVNHLDWYRLPRVQGTDREMAEECFNDWSISVVEWPERGKEILPDARFEVSLAYGPGENRTIRIHAKGARNAARLKKI